MITKKQFEQTYKKYSPNKCELFYIKHISIASLLNNIWPAIFSSFGLLLPFLLTLGAHFFGLPHCLFIICSFTYVALLAIIGTYSFSIWYKRRVRISKICKELEILRKEYNNLVERYYNENYYPDIKDYINSLLPE